MTRASSNMSTVNEAKEELSSLKEDMQVITILYYFILSCCISNYYDLICLLCSNISTLNEAKEELSSLKEDMQVITSLFVIVFI